MTPTADLSDDHADDLQYAEAVFTSYGARRSFSGPVATVVVFEDNVLYEEALNEVEPGSVIVLDAGGSRECAVMGDRLAGIAVERGLPGVIVNGCIRDSAEIASMDVGVLALGTHPRKSRKQAVGARDVPVTFAGVLWTPGSHVYVDEDGIVLSDEALLGADT